MTKQKKEVQKITENIKQNEDKELLISIIEEMTKKYTLTEVKLSLFNYKKTHNPSTITRENNLRDKVLSSKTFTDYLKSLSDEELNTIIEKYKKERIIPTNILVNLLDNISKQTYISAVEKGYDGKKQVAVSLIKLSYGDYSGITRELNSRAQAINNIKKDQVEQIIKESLKEKNLLQENKQIYLTYAEYIEYACNNNKSNKKKRK